MIITQTPFRMSFFGGGTDMESFFKEYTFIQVVYRFSLLLVRLQYKSKIYSTLSIEDKNKPTDKVTAWLGSAEEYTVYPECSKEVDSEKKKRVENSWEMFKLGPLYEKHSDYIRNILQAKQIYTEEYLEQLVKNFPSAFDSMDDLKNMVYFNYLDEKDWGKRILAKLTHDLEADNP